MENKQPNIACLKAGKITVWPVHTKKEALLALSQVVYQASKAGQVTGVFLLGTPRESFFEQSIVVTTGVAHWKLANGYFTSKEYHSVQKELADMAELPLFIDDEPDLDIADMVERVQCLGRDLQKQGKSLNLVVINAFSAHFGPKEQACLQTLALEGSMAILVFSKARKRI